MKQDTICCYCISKCMMEGGGGGGGGGGDIEESLHACINRARLTACEVGIFSITKYLPNCWTLKVKIKHLAQELL